MCVFFLAGQATCLRLKSPPRSHFSLEVAAFGITGHSSSAPLGGLWALFPALVEGFAGFFRTALKQNKGKQQTIFCLRRESIGYLETEKNKLRMCARPYVGGYVTSLSTLLPSKNTFWHRSELSKEASSWREISKLITIAALRSRRIAFWPSRGWEILKITRRQLLVALLKHFT